MAERNAAIARWVPGLTPARTYRRDWLRPELVAGVVLAAIQVPQGTAYAELAGLKQRDKFRARSTQ